jgi:histone-lysine N-methyltransferase SETMAR
LISCWFDLVTDYEQIWLCPEGKPPERHKHTIQDPTMMLTIAWNPLGFHLLDALPKGRTFNAEYHRDNILMELIPLRPQVDGRKLVIHADNTRPHVAQKCRAFCTENRLQLAVHPPYSPDLARSDFFLFGHVKCCLHEINFPSRDELLTAIHKIVAAIPERTFRDVFDN